MHLYCLLQLYNCNCIPFLFPHSDSPPLAPYQASSDPLVTFRMKSIQVPPPAAAAATLEGEPHQSRRNKGSQGELSAFGDCLQGITEKSSWLSFYSMSGLDEASYIQDHQPQNSLARKVASFPFCRWESLNDLLKVNNWDKILTLLSGCSARVKIAFPRRWRECIFDPHSGAFLESSFNGCLQEVPW